jgi:hypothetical protein
MAALPTRQLHQFSPIWMGVASLVASLACVS